MVVGAAIAYLVFVVITSLAQRFQVQVTGRLAAWVMNDLRVKVFAHLQRLSLGFFTEEKAGVVMSRMTSDIENLQQLLQDGLSQLAIQGLTMVVITAILFTINVELALITVVLILPTLFAASVWFRRASERGYDRVRDGIASVLADLSESLHGVRIVTAHNRQRHNVIHHRNVVGEYRDANNYTARVNAVYGPGTQLLGVLGQAVLLAIGGSMVVNHTLSLGGLVAFFLYLNRFFQPIQLLVQQYNTYQQGQASVNKLRDLVDTEPEVREAVDAVDLPPIEGGIAFDHLSFEYLPGRPVIEDVDLVMAPGETVAFVGPTGAGKSTMAKLVTRFYDPTSGRVLIDGHDLRDVTMRSLRSQLGVVPQEPFLFAGTIGDNIAFARPDASDERSTRPSTRSASPTWWPACPRASTPWSTNGVRPCRRENASSSPWPGPSWPIHGYWCSTRPRPTWTCSRRPRSSRPSTCCWRTGPPSSSPTGCPRPCGPTGSSSSTRAASSRSAPTTSWWRPGAATPRCTPPGCARATWPSTNPPSTPEGDFGPQRPGP